MPLTSSVMQQMMARFRNYLQPIKSQDRGGFHKKGAMLFEQVQRVILAKKYFGVRCTLTNKVNLESQLEIKYGTQPL